MRTLIILLLLYGIASADPFMKCDCQENTDFIIVNGLQYDCPDISIDISDMGFVLNDLNTMEIIAVGQGGESSPFIFSVDKSENRVFDFYKYIFDKSQKDYFSNTSIKVRR